MVRLRLEVERIWGSCRYAMYDGTGARKGLGNMERNLAAGQSLNQKSVVVKVPRGVKGEARTERSCQRIAALMVEHFGDRNNRNFLYGRRGVFLEGTGVFSRDRFWRGVRKCRAHRDVLFDRVRRDRLVRKA
jgi:hypothetical protein